MNELENSGVQTVAEELEQETSDPEGSLALARCLVGKESDGSLGCSYGMKMGGSRSPQPLLQVRYPTGCSG